MSDKEVVDRIVEEYFRTGSVRGAYKIVENELSDQQKQRLKNGLNL